MTALVVILSAGPAGAPKKGAAIPKSATPIERAEALLAGRKLSEAEDVLRAAMKQDPAANGFRLVLGRVLLAKEKPVEAYLELQYEGMRAGSAPSSRQAFIEARDVVARTRGIEANDARYVEQALDIVDKDAERALSYLAEVSKERASHFVIRFYRAEARIRVGDLETAVKELRALQKEDPWFVPARVQEAMALRVLRRQSEAEAVAADARRIAPDHWALKPLELLKTPLPPR